jgi:UDP-3-O-[3-hydroxymyristoyl] N-acetylglucosamine deacetylase
VILGECVADNPREIAVEGVGLHTGAPSRVVLRARPGPVTVHVGAVEARLDELVVVSTARATTVESRCGALRIATVEHAFAALGGLGVYEGVAVVVCGPEMPLLDGGAAAWCAALDRLPWTAREPRSRIVREAVVEVGTSRFELSPCDRVDVEVHVEFDGFDAAQVFPVARWNGSAGDFRSSIAPARTFALARDVDELVQAGLARHIDPASVVVLARDAAHHAGAPFLRDEPARHKLLDLIGDLHLYGGPPRGRLRALRPGHAANHQAMQLARADGIVVLE